MRKAIFEARYEDVGELLDIKRAVEDFVEGDIEVRDEVVYYKGNHRLHGVVVDKLLDMLRAGMKDSAPITNYITRLMDNPSSNSVDELYTFLGYRSLPITPEGKILGFKGVQDDYYSNSGNADTIVVQGETNSRHQIYNGIGETIEVKRRCVDDNKDNHCSHGLHIGSFDYASGWGGDSGRLLLVEFDPQDAVSVPTDCSYQKLRVSKYKVVADLTDSKTELNKVVYQPNKPIYGSDSDDEECEGSCDDCECDYDEEDYMEEDVSDEDISRLQLRNYIENKLGEGIQPSLNLIASLKVCRDEGWKCKDVALIVQSLGFTLKESDDVALSAWTVSE